MSRTVLGIVNTVACYSTPEPIVEPFSTPLLYATPDFLFFEFDSSYQQSCRLMIMILGSVLPRNSVAEINSP